AELRLCQLCELALRSEVRAADLLEHRMLDPFLCRDTHAERDAARDLAHDAVDATERVEVCAGQLRLDCLVAAADVVADARRGDVALVGDRAADGLAVARVVVGAEDAEVGVACGHAALQLLEAAGVDVAEGLDRAHSLAPFLLSSAETP